MVATDIKCEMDLLQCQKIRKLVTLYRQLKNESGTTSSNRIDRIEFLSELYRILVEEPHSTILDEVNTHTLFIKNNIWISRLIDGDDDDDNNN